MVAIIDTAFDVLSQAHDTTDLSKQQTCSRKGALLELALLL